MREHRLPVIEVDFKSIRRIQANSETELHLDALFPLYALVIALTRNEQVNSRDCTKQTHKFAVGQINVECPNMLANDLRFRALSEVEVFNAGP